MNAVEKLLMYIIAPKCATQQCLIAFQKPGT